MELKNLSNWSKNILIGLALLGIWYLVQYHNSQETHDQSWQNSVPQEDSMESESPKKIVPAEQMGDNEEYGGVKGMQSREAGNSMPRDQLKADELLPKDVDTKWSEVNPRSQGDISDQNFLDAGHHIGINTVGQSLRNANMSIRSEPANPQKNVSPWMNTTIGPDLSRRPLEVGCDN